MQVEPCFYLLQEEKAAASQEEKAAQAKGHEQAEQAAREEEEVLFLCRMRTSGIVTKHRIFVMREACRPGEQAIMCTQFAFHSVSRTFHDGARLMPHWLNAGGCQHGGRYGTSKSRDGSNC